MKIPRNPSDDYSAKQISQRLQWLEELVGKDLPYLRGAAYPPMNAKGKCENYLGVVGVPVGLAGPVQINGDHANGQFVIPLATTEGTLVASFSRGMRVITTSGGCNIVAPSNSVSDEACPRYRFIGDALTKVSAVILKNPADAPIFEKWIKTHIKFIEDAANATSRYARLIELTPLFQGDVVGLAFTYETGQAMGLNMATKANQAACNYIVENSAGLVAGYYNTLGGDKRFVPDQAKGRHVSASVCIPKAIIRDTLRTTPERMRRFLNICNTILSQRGATAPNIHAANALTALFIACGQDPAFVTVSFKNACTNFEVMNNGDLLASVTLPNIIVGTVGGGTQLPAQRECLQILGCLDNPLKLAEIAATVVLAGEISVAGAVSANEFTKAHTGLGRGVNLEARHRTQESA